MQYNIIYDDPLQSIIPKIATDILFPQNEIKYEQPPVAGTGVTLQDGKLKALRIGRLQQSDNFYSVIPQSQFYEPQIGDVVIGRVQSVMPGRWQVDIKSTQSASLTLDQINLPGLLRQKDSVDETNMRLFLKENDLLVTEMRMRNSIHTRNHLHTKLQHGILLEMEYPSVVKQKFIVYGDFEIILADNKRIWIGAKRQPGEGVEDNSFQDFTEDQLSQFAKLIEIVKNGGL